METTPTPKPSLALIPVRIVLYLGLIGFVVLWSLSLLLVPGAAAARWLEWPLTAALLGLIVSAGWRRFRLFQTWSSAGIGAALFVPLLTWLAWDDATITHPLTLGELSPAPASQAGESYQATLAYTRADDQAAPRQLPPGNLSFKNSPVDKPGAWRKEVLKEREKVAAEWAALAPARDWLGELDRFAAIGDIGTASYEAKIINLSVLRRVVEAACAQAMLLAVDGKGDEAFAILRQVLSVNLKLERHARSDGRLLAAHRGITRAVATAHLVLAATPVSAPERAALAAVIAERDPAAFARRLAWLPYVFANESLLKEPGIVFAAVAGDIGLRDRNLVKLFSWLRPFMVLPRNTANLLARFAAAAERQMLDPTDDSIARDGVAVLLALSSGSPKNFGGRALVLIAVPNYEKLGESLRNGEAARLGLLAELRK